MATRRIVESWRVVAPCTPEIKLGYACHESDCMAVEPIFGLLKPQLK
jgi:hypothetical protein